ncbi:MAG: DUF3800 domain-containing protein [Nitrososphaeraceae archaeon]
MYVDDSGNPLFKDNSAYYVISGLIIHESNIQDVEQFTQEYKDRNFEGEYTNAEIHVHDIYKSQPPFSGLTLEKKYEILDSLYTFIGGLPICVISVGIDKVELIQNFSHWNIFNAAWTFLIERFNNYIHDKGGRINRGIFIVDKSSKIPEYEITTIVNRLRKNGSNFQSITNIVEEVHIIKTERRDSNSGRLCLLYIEASHGL